MKNLGDHFKSRSSARHLINASLWVEIRSQRALEKMGGLRVGSRPDAGGRQVWCQKRLSWLSVAGPLVQVLGQRRP